MCVYAGAARARSVMCGKKPYARPATKPAHDEPVILRTKRNVRVAVRKRPSTD